MAGAGFDFNALSHPARASLSEEMHVRKFPSFSVPARLMQIVMLCGEGTIAASLEQVRALCAPFGVQVADGRKYFTCQLGGLGFAWERHTEFVTYTFIAPPDGADLFSTAPFAAIPPEWLGALPAQAIRATLITVLGQHDTQPDEAELERHFAASDLVTCDVAAGKARIWSDFRLKPEGFGRLLVADRGLAGGETAQLVQRLQELGNYRNMALLGLPIAQRLTPEVSRLEQRLAALTAAVAGQQSRDDALLEELSYLSAELARLMAETRYRMSASRAYAQLCHDRVEELEVGAVRGFQTLIDFTERRLTPALRTCESFSTRLEDLSQRAAWTSSLLTTRVDTALSRQNLELLESMNRRSDLQLRLQQTVEGLSVVAISYYAVGLVGYVVKSLHAEFPAISYEVVTGALAVPVVLTVWFFIARLRRKFHDHA